MKLNGWARTSTGLIFGLGLILAVVGCGVKGPPVPPRSVPPGAITDLGYTIDQDQVTLTWSIPTGEAAGSAGLAGFVVYRAAISAAEPVCDGCPVLFRRVATVDLEALMVGHPDLQTATFQQTIERGYQYIFKVVAFSKDGQQGPDSNRVDVP